VDRELIEGKCTSFCKPVVVNPRLIKLLIVNQTDNLLGDDIDGL
jgi:hypothetical protein